MNWKAFYRVVAVAWVALVFGAWFSILLGYTEL